MKDRLREGITGCLLARDDSTDIRSHAGQLQEIGKELPLLDGPDIVTGRAVFGADVKLPVMPA